MIEVLPRADQIGLGKRADRDRRLVLAVVIEVPLAVARAAGESALGREVAARVEDLPAAGRLAALERSLREPRAVRIEARPRRRAVHEVAAAEDVAFVVAARPIADHLAVRERAVDAVVVVRAVGDLVLLGVPRDQM